jgi:hypothetical protein
MKEKRGKTHKKPKNTANREEQFLQAEKIFFFCSLCGFQNEKRKKNAFRFLFFVCVKQQQKTNRIFGFSFLVFHFLKNNENANNTKNQRKTMKKEDEKQKRCCWCW